MKYAVKAAIYFVALVFMWQTLTGCQSYQSDCQYKTYIASVSNDGTRVAQEGNYWSYNAKIPEREKRSASCEFMGESITGEYLRTRSAVFTSYTTDTYATSDGKRFSVRSDTGELKSVNFLNREYHDSEPFLEDVANPQETAVAIAAKVAKDYIQLSDYVQTVKEVRTTETERDGKTYCVTYYEVVFTKYIGGYPTRDRIVMEINSKGNITKFTKGDIGGLDDFSLEVDSKKVNDSVIAKVNEVYSQKSYTVEQVNIEAQTLARTPEGHMGIASQVVVTFQEGDHALRTAVLMFTNLQGA